MIQSAINHASVSREGRLAANRQLRRTGPAEVSESKSARLAADLLGPKEQPNIVVGCTCQFEVVLMRNRHRAGKLMAFFNAT